MSRILIVEDESIIRSALRRLLEKNGYEVSDAGSVAEACEGFSLDSFDLIITDLRLRGCVPRLPSGWRTCICRRFWLRRSAIVAERCPCWADCRFSIRAADQSQ